MEKSPEFKEFKKIPRLFREIVISEKLDGTNAQIHITEDGNIFAGSRTRWLTPENDNYGFCKWVMSNKDELMKLGAGSHYGEWWGNGIQRNYGLSEKRFSLFNVSKWGDESIRPKCCHVVPTINSGIIFDTDEINNSLNHLKHYGSVAAPGFKFPEGIVIFHTASGNLFKITIEKDEVPKGRNNAERN